jgi:hypothetical protein
MSHLVKMTRQTGDPEQAGEHGTVRYAGRRGGSGFLIAGEIVLESAALPDPPPDIIQLTIEWPEARVRAPRPPAEYVREAAAGPTEALRDLHTGDRVTVVKSRVAGAKNPPEWLEQYLGRSGRVVRVTAHGAEVDLDGDTTWFSFAELLPKE